MQNDPQLAAGSCERYEQDKLTWMFSDSDSSSHQIVFSAGRHQRVDPLQGPSELCGFSIR